jgi:hypothetical protein
MNWWNAMWNGQWMNGCRLGADAGHGLKDCNVDSVQWVDGVFSGTRVSEGGAGGPARRRASWRGARWSGL